MRALALCQESRALDPACVDRALRERSPEARVQWALQHLPGRPVLSSSFGAQSAVMLHLLARIAPDIPVVLIDTGYLFPETYRFADELRERLALNLHVFRPGLSAAWQEARLGKRWEHGIEGIEAFNRDNKVEPMARALDELGAGTWFAGLRRSQSNTRAKRPFGEIADGRWKVYPILDFSDRDVHEYLTEHDLPYHPLWDRGYVSIGDWPTTRSLAEVDDLEATRFFGLKRECGLHEV